MISRSLDLFDEESLPSTESFTRPSTDSTIRRSNSMSLEDAPVPVQVSAPISATDLEIETSLPVTSVSEKNLPGERIVRRSEHLLRQPRLNCKDGIRQ